MFSAFDVDGGDVAVVDVAGHGGGCGGGGGVVVYKVSSVIM